MERAAFARRILAAAGAAQPNDRLFAAFRDTPRERFLPPGTPAALASADDTVALGPPGINNGQPSLHAACIAALAPQTGESVLHVGAGTGYYTAILARMVGASGRVDAYELLPQLAAQACENLREFPQAAVHAASGADAPLPASDIVYVNCGATGPAPPWLAALRPHGRLLFPLTGAASAGAMLLAQRPRVPSATWQARLIVPVSFVDCSGLRAPEDEGAVTTAFARGAASSVRWLHLGPPSECPNEIWLSTPNWQLATGN
ncbi:MAG: protein-L-isoaspartate O-methyltransferase family protein [Terriglobales bacterium]